MFGNDVRNEKWYPFIIDYGNVYKLDADYHEMATYIKLENTFEEYIVKQNGLCDYLIYKIYLYFRNNKKIEKKDFSVGQILYYLRYKSYYGCIVKLNDYNDIIEMLVKEVKSGDECSKCILADYYLNKSEDYFDETAYEYLKELSLLQDRIAQRLMGDILLFHNKNYDDARQEYELAVKNGDTESLIRIGHICEQNGDIKEALKYNKMAVPRGSLTAKNNIAVYTLDNPTEREQAYIYLKEAAQYGHALAMSNLGLIYAYQEDKKDSLKALKWQTMAAQTGSIMAIERLAYMYEDGIACEIDEEKAFKYRLAE